MTTASVGNTEQRVVLDNVSWATYERLLADLVDSSAPRLTFDRGVLEIVSPTGRHERLNRLLATFVEEAADRTGIDLENLGSTTFRRADLERGFEPDSCFYIANAAAVPGKSTMDLETDPPPDLVIEIDISRSSIDKAAIYARVGVPEVWRYDGHELHMARLDHGDYIRIERSAALPKLTANVLTELLKKSQTISRSTVLHAFREWLGG